MVVQGDLAPIMNERARRLFPEITKATAPAPGKRILAPQAIVITPPDYPTAYRIFATEAEVWIAFIVGRDGSVIDARSLSEYESLFTKAAIDAARTWKFRPGKVNDQPTEFLITVPIRFHLMK